MAENKMENKMDKVESLLKWLVSGEKDEDGNWLSDDDTQLVCDALEYYLNMHGQKNKMPQVAALFGKKLNEPFTIRGERYVFGEKGFGYGNEHGVACHDPSVLERLLAGQVKIDE